MQLDSENWIWTEDQWTVYIAVYRFDTLAAIAIQAFRLLSLTNYSEAYRFGVGFKRGRRFTDGFTDEKCIDLHWGPRTVPYLCEDIPPVVDTDGFEHEFEYEDDRVGRD